MLERERERQFYEIQVINIETPCSRNGPNIYQKKKNKNTMYP